MAMTIEEIKEAAYDYSRLPPSNASMPDALLWYSLRDIYKRFRDGLMTREQGENLKNIAVQQYNANCTRLQIYERLIKIHAEMYKDIEVTADAYKKERTRENADRMIDVLYGTVMKTKEEEVVAWERLSEDPESTPTK